MNNYNNNKTLPKRIIYLSGSGNIVESHKYWKKNTHDPTEISITFSSQVEDYCKNIKANLLAISYNNNEGILVDGNFRLENIPKYSFSKFGFRYYFHEFTRAIKILCKAVFFRADAAIVESGCMPYFMQTFFTIAGIQVVQVLHNTLWPRGYRHQKLGRRLSLKLDRLFFRWCPIAIVGVSPECCHQVRQLVGPKHPPLYEMRAQFDADYFSRIQPPPPHSRHPFSILFIGRIVKGKGVFDILQIARKLNCKLSQRVEWHICGTGSDFIKLEKQRDALGLQETVHLHSWVPLDLLVEIYGNCHAAIVPTRSTFYEGLAMTAAEAVLAGRPVVTNDIVPAATLLGNAAILAMPEDTESYVEKIIELVENAKIYEKHRVACKNAADEFLDRSMGYTAVLDRVFSAHFNN